ncbi:Hypothetical Protein FCC1311_090972 [Hondaea fermentalgiana]|uniref:Alkaline ceramidase 3 n=1 Tax=Hondaea fermentalgiana TaxID=2315210 RepID=A0A2R5GPS1_9STRA|nr:Hypothetical Protein FCC1311_090972 [Hondaea fermentalgiana]|eukprot:GBG32872.1 Hypothetical Protein FCC1311_090972 [Hondaea fermentalgiana]
MPFLVRTSEDVLPSRVAWPFTSTGTWLTFAIVGVSSGAATWWLESCQASAECTANAWTSDFWGEPRPTHDSEYCETYNYGAFMQQHANSLSNLVFCALGLLVFLCGLADMVRIKSILAAPTDAPYHVENHAILCPIYSFMFGGALLTMGIFSFAFHAHNTRFTQQMDVGAIFILLNVIMAGAFQLNLDPDGKRSGIIMFRFVLFVVTFGLSYLMTYYKYSISTLELMLGQLAAIGIFILTAVFRRTRLRRGKDHRLFFRGWRYIFVSVILLCVGYGMRELGVSLLYCEPDGAFQFHALWHALCALSAFLIYLFFRSERMHKPKYVRDQQVLPMRSSARRDPDAPVVYVAGDVAEARPVY